jgi:hypothetical protein
MSGKKFLSTTGVFLTILISSIAFAGFFDSPRPDDQTGLETRPANTARIYGISALHMETIVEVDGKTVKDIAYGYITIYVKPGQHTLTVKLGNKQVFKNEITLKADQEYFFVIKPVLGGQMEFVADQDKFYSFYDDYKGKRAKKEDRKREDCGMIDLSK